MLCLRPPAPAFRTDAPLAGLPDTAATLERLRGTAFADQLTATAEQILAHRFPLLGIEITTGDQIRWRRDYLSGIETAALYFPRIPYLDAVRAGDHKVIWELNRHQHLVLLAQAFRLTSRDKYFHEIVRQLESWDEQNPFQRGINWASALEVGHRALSWTWVFHLVGEKMPDALRREFLVGLYRHGCHLEYNLSYYFSRNTHLLGEAVSLHSLGELFPDFPRAARWKSLGAKVVETELDYQVHPDGAHFEHSSYYHVYALDLFLSHYILSGRPARFRARLIQMAEYLDTLLGPPRAIPLLGDDDGGRLFHPYGTQVEYGRATLATCAVLLGVKEWAYSREDLYPQAAWWLGSEAFDAQAPNPTRPGRSVLFPQVGIGVMSAGDVQVIVDVGPFGAGRGGHSHSDTLSLVLRDRTDEVLVDAGTYTYTGDIRWRHWFRGSAAHNLLRVNGANQAEEDGPFAWVGKPEVRMREWSSDTDQDFIDAECRCGGLVYRRRVLLVKPDLLFVLDQVELASGATVEGKTFLLEQFWHPGRPIFPLGPNVYRIGSRAQITFPADNPVVSAQGGEHGWRSRVFGCKEETPVVCVSAERVLPAALGAVIELGRSASTARLAFVKDGGDLWLSYDGASRLHVRFPEAGTPKASTSFLGS